MEAMIETIVSKLRRLSADKLQIISEFVNFLEWQESQGGSEVESAMTILTKKSTREERIALNKVAQGRFAHLPNSSEDFARRKQYEIDLEDRRPNNL
ncbi:hypothetical protein [cf. Phormidesmis sp. LEGE 11477]|uniref:hypothetical protein n=1 Tax=cf. Phormidesmis sp. LEGE 11477 TaxID=1828680 RepID=UPI001881C12E|nr:hypothetical protein [cf. Phormidesmis sp. LEGE 11477]MBE9062500.1 hypothetical protein [cf. Phormidesmis sp. LEGE 11477]